MTDHGQQTQQTMARRRIAVAAPTVTPIATVSLAEQGKDHDDDEDEDIDDHEVAIHKVFDWYQSIKY